MRPHSFLASVFFLGCGGATDDEGPATGTLDVSGAEAGTATSDSGTTDTGETTGGGQGCIPDPGTPPAACAAPDGVFFSDIAGTQVLRMDLDGANPTVILDATHADDLALDRDGGRLWWVTGDATLLNANLDGTDTRTVLDGLPSIYALALDIPTGSVYWNNQVGEPKIQRACMDGTGIEEVLPGGECCMIGLALDPVDRYLYWMDGYYGGPVSRMAIGTTTPEVIGTTVGIANGIDVDHAAGKVYWTEYGNGPDDDVVRRANLDGSALETLLTAADGLQTPQHIAVDPVGGKFYLADLHAETVLRANLDGTGREDLWVQVGSQPRAIALDRVEPCQ